MATAQLATLHAQARRVARISDDAAPVYLFSDADVPMFDTLHVPRRCIKDLVPLQDDAPPLVLALCVPDSPPRVLRTYVITAALWARRERLTYIGYDGERDAYTIVLPAIPRPSRGHVTLDMQPTPAPAVAAAQVPAKPRACCARRALLQTMWLTREDIVNALSDDSTLAAIDGDAGAHYGESSLFMLEQRALLLQQLIAPELALDRMRHGAHALFPKLACHRLRGAVAYLAGVVAPSMTAPHFSTTPCKKPHGGERRGLRAAVQERVLPGAGLAAAWLAGEDTFLCYMLSDPVDGLATCSTCATAILEALYYALEANAARCPWIGALRLVDATGHAPRLTRLASVHDQAQEPWYCIPRALAYRLPAAVDALREDPVTGEWCMSQTALLYDLVPLLAEKLAGDVLWTFFDLVMRSGAGDANVPVGLARLVDTTGAKLAETRAFLEGTLGRMGYDSVPRLAEWREHVQTPLMVRMLEAHPLALPPIQMDRGPGQLSEDTAQWYAAVRGKHRTIASRLPDIEDMVKLDLLPPCMKAVVTGARASGKLNGYMSRFVFAAWVVDMGYDDADTVKLLGISDAINAKEIVGHARSARVAQSAAKPGQCASWSCSGSINGDATLATACPVRARALDNTAQHRPADKGDVVKVRWACTETLPHYSKGAWPQHAIVHPLDYVVLRMEKQ